MSAIDEKALRIVPLTRIDTLANFSSANDDLNDFLENEAIRSQENLLSKTFLCFCRGHIAGFLTLVTDTIEVKLVDAGDGVSGYPHQKYPAIKIARLAVDKKFERKGVGRFLILAAVGKVHQISKDVGCRYITLDSKRESVGFYEKFGFKIIKRYANRNFPPMYLNMYPIVQQMLQEDETEGNSTDPALMLERML
jgi:GNAT superfamily N-acetyltransferase